MKILAFSLLLPTFAFAMTNEIWSRSDQKAKCDTYSKEISAWWPKDSAIDTRAVPADKIARALEILKQIPYPSDDDVKQIQSSLKDDFGDSYLKWLGIVGIDCPTIRLNLIKPLINTKTDNAQQSAAIASTVKIALVANKYPTLLNTMIDMIITDHALERSLWKSSAAHRPELKKMRVDLKSELHKFTEQYNPTFASVGQKFKDSSEGSIEEFKKLPEFDKLKAGVATEEGLATKYAQQLKNLIAKLDK